MIVFKTTTTNGFSVHRDDVIKNSNNILRLIYLTAEEGLLGRNVLLRIIICHVNLLINFPLCESTTWQ